MARLKKSRGFTLVELLVVITIIGMLVSLLLPAIQAAREAGRRNTCMNNMRQAALGLTMVEQTGKGFPGYVDKVNKSGVDFRVSWVVSILPSLEANTLYQNWRNPNLIIQWDEGTASTYNRDQYVTRMSALVCASNANPDLPDDALSWVANTGIARLASDNQGATFDWPEDSASGVMFNQVHGDAAFTAAVNPQPFRKVNMDYITSNDGSTNTLLLSENLQAGRWASDPVNGLLPFQTDFAARQNVGMVWFLTGNGNNDTTTTVPLPLAANFNPASIGINDLAQAVSGIPKGAYNSGNLSEPTGLAYARPSANHPGGVNAMFCGMNNRFLSENMEYHVYTQLMTPYEQHVVVDYTGGINAASNVPIRANFPQGTIQSPTAVGGGATSVPVPWGYILDEDDL